MAGLAILSRWLHVISACLVIGGIFFARFILPRGLKMLDETTGGQAMHAWRRSLKMTMHTVILLLILTGIYNTYLAWDKYKLDDALLHSLWGTHVLLALLAIAIILYVLAGPEPRRGDRGVMAVVFVILLLVVAAASTVKWARERVVARHAAEMIQNR